MSSFKRLKELNLVISSGEQLLKDANEIRGILSLEPVETVPDISNGLSTREEQLLRLTLESSKASRKASLILGVLDESDDSTTVQQKIDSQLTHVISNREKQSRELTRSNKERGIQLRDKTDVLLYIAYLDLQEEHPIVGERRLVRRVKSLMTLNGAPRDELAALTQSRIRTRLTEFKANPVICDAKTFAHVTNVKFS
jgi:hypothetical protein